MDVRCPQCLTLYELDVEPAKASIVTLKCSQCQHVFRIETKQSSIVQENQRRWMIRNHKTGDILYITGFDVLHKWIMEGRVSKRDEVSRTGKKWVQLSTIGEFMPIFQVVESINNLLSSSQPDDSQIARVADAELPVPTHDEERERVKTSIQFGGVSTTEEVTQRARPTMSTPLPPSPTPRRQTGPQPLPPEPQRPSVHIENEWEIGVPSTTFDEEHTAQVQITRSFPWGAIVALMVVVAGIYAFVFHKDEIQRMISPEREIVVVSPQETKVEAETPSPEDGWELALLSGQKAQKTALDAASDQNEKIMSDVIRALRPGMDQAMGVATEEAELVAEGGGEEYRLAEAKKTLNRGRHQQALQMYQDVFNKNPRSSEAATGMGWALLELGRHDEAARQFRFASELDTRSGDALIGLGSVERQRGNLEEAMRAYDLYLGRYPRGDKVSIAQYQLDALKRQLGL